MFTQCQPFSHLVIIVKETQYLIFSICCFCATNIVLVSQDTAAKKYWLHSKIPITKNLLTSTK